VSLPKYLHRAAAAVYLSGLQSWTDRVGADQSINRSLTIRANHRWQSDSASDYWGIPSSPKTLAKLASIEGGPA